MSTQKGNKILSDKKRSCASYGAHSLCAFLQFLPFFIFLTLFLNVTLMCDTTCGATLKTQKFENFKMQKFKTLNTIIFVTGKSFILKE